VDWLNYHHLLYFWVVAKEGSVTRASRQLRLAGPTISTQVHRLEDDLGKKLFARKGRHLVLTETGHVVFHYADEIFSLGQELLDAVRGRGRGGQPMRLVVGVSDVLAKSIVHRILEPAFRLRDRVHVVCREDRTTEAFVAELALHLVDVVLSDAPAGPGTSVRAFSHPLGECGSAFFAAPAHARSLRRDFPHSLGTTKMMLPGSGSTFRRAIDEWLQAREIRPQIAAELDDAALAMILAEEGLGVVAAPDVIEREVRRRYRLHLVGRAPEVRQRFYAISIERKIKNPALAAICDVARTRIFV
jgi:LysR family transcriptional regulator, transcriptional activator of nhaA